MNAWLEVDLNIVRENAEIVRRHVGPQTGVVAVVKADAYGHGIEAIVETLELAGIDSYAVITLDEARRVRSRSPKDVLIMGYLDDEELEDAIREGFVLSLYAKEMVAPLTSISQKLGKKARIQLKVETGMNRLGCQPEEALAILNEPPPELEIESIFSHLYSSSNAERSHGQLERFRPIMEEAKRLGYKVSHHLSNSHGLPHFTEGFLDFVRVGLALYGVEPVAPGLKPCLQAKSVVMQVKSIKAGDGVSYNHLFVADKDMEVAIVAMGYSEGLSQAFTGKCSVLVKGQRTPVIGQICMNLICIDATGLALQRRDEVVAIGRQGENEIRVAELAQNSGLRHHEIITKLGKSLPKVYLGGQKATTN